MNQSGIDFNYSLTLFKMRCLFLSIFFIGVLFFLVLNATLLWLIIFIVLFILAIILVGISPMLTKHSINVNHLNLRQGLLFNAKIPWTKIESIDVVEFESWRYGVSASLFKARIFIATRKFNLISIKMRQKKRFKSVLWKLADEIIIDVNEPDMFISEAMKYLEIS